MSDLFIHWSINPEAFSLGPLTVRWYGILYGCAFIASYYTFKELLKFDKLPDDFADRALIYMILGTVIGARIGDCFFYHPAYYLQHPLEIFATWKGGLSSHGGAIGILTALYLFGRKMKKPYIWVLDRVVIVIGVAGFFIRMGNLMNSEIYGHATTLAWGFIFERNGETVPKHPTQIYEALYYALTYLVLRFVYRRCDNRPRPFLIFGLFLIMVFGFRFCIEFIKNPQEDFEQNMMFNMGQWLSAPFVILGIISLIISSRQEKPAPLLDNFRQPQQKKTTAKPQPQPARQTAGHQWQGGSIKLKKRKK
ncbi:MAG: prolipoprotein diacylglyceryl transferase [Bacteroidales bacterium]|jgi:prolipoprotein diacylglyceryl transferase|nr:prolipoprotein diacylglyceryl transferase [Bacteroidales bacterium]